ncbi:MAG: HD-GYP domain-containing protein [Candidatus Omnitrophica bacterium]|nr:HD-GYP domain-containing protein [Candidatus Omnitrophota bacterium]
MKREYRVYLEKAARQTILIHRSDTLIRLILRTIIRTLKIEHAGMFIYDKNRQVYVMKFSKGSSGFKVPQEFVKITKENPLVQYFINPKLKFPKNHILLSRINSLIRSNNVKHNQKMKKFLEELKFNLSLYGAYACIGGFFRNELIGILLLGKKKNKKHFSQDELGFLSILATDVVMALKNARLIEDLNRQLEINKRLFLQIVAALASSIEAKDKYTIGHTERVVNYSFVILENLKRYIKDNDLEKFKENLKIAALLHDIGKIGIPERILNKKTCLNGKENLIVKNHPIIGANILNKIEEFKDVLAGVKYHHERYDGKGYPSGIGKRKIPLIASIISLADAFDAMTTDRPYRKALSFNVAIREIKKNRKKQFSPMVVDAFLKGLPKIKKIFSGEN